jgi:hypothetical protein
MEKSDFEQLLPDRELFFIRETPRALRSSSCRICRIIGMALSMYDDASSPTMLAWSPRAHNRPNWGGDESTYGFLRLLNTEWSSRSPYQHQMLSLSRNRPANVELELCILDVPKRIDFGMLKGWIKECEDQHPGCRPPTPSKLVNLRVFDCINKTIITAPAHCSYLALSYVWGPRVNKSHEDMSTTRTDFLTTIEDSMTATIMLGYRYLWVDSIVSDSFFMSFEYLETYSQLCSRALQLSN